MRQVRALPSGDAVCYKCHVDKQGPFVYEHVPVKTEGCSSCHTPHGSTNPRLLKVSLVNMLCLQCHTFPTLRAGAKRSRAQSVGEVSGLHHVSHADSWLQFQRSIFQVREYRWHRQENSSCNLSLGSSRNRARGSRRSLIYRNRRASDNPGRALLRLMVVSTTKCSSPNLPAPSQTPPAEPDGVTSGGYQIHSSVELGYRANGVTGSGDMYDTLVNLQTGPRLLDQTLSMQSLDHQGLLFDNLYLNSFGWGGDPNNAMRLRADKDKWYNLQSSFRRDQYFSDYNLLANP